MRKKILFVTNHFRFSNGVASVLRSLIANLDMNKYEVSLLAIYDFNKSFAAPIMDRIKVVKGFGFYFRGFDKFVNLIPNKLLYEYFVKDEYDLEVAFQFGIPTKMLSASENPHRICWMHTFDEKMILREYYKKYPLVVNVAEIGMKKMVNKGFPPDMCTYCYNIIDEDNIIAKVNEPIEIKKTHSIVVITVARLAPDKAFMRYLQCIKRLLDKSEGKADIEFWILGDGSEKPKMDEYIKSNDLTNNIRLLGLQTNPYKYMINADCYFCCSYREGFSTACQEAAILGIPVVSVKVDGAEELFELQCTGEILENNEDGILNGLIDLVNNPKKLEKWTVNAKKNSYKFFKNSRIEKAQSILESV